MATLLFTVTHEDRYTKTVEDGTEQDHLVNFFLGRPPYQTPWFLVDGDLWLRRGAIVSAEVQEPRRSIAA